jgi:uncharacterized damage-inducible protein DinB
VNPLVDLGRHLAWADAEHWRAFEQSPGALQDAAIRDRLHHLHLVQRAFCWIVQADGSSFQQTTPAEFPSNDALKQYSRGGSTNLAACIAKVSVERLSQTVQIPWFTNPTLTLTVAEALMQALMHSQWHRGQNATRFRELGGEPPTTDLIMWFWKGRPMASW